ncbi:kinase-like protein [Parathielavia hyrcaniae]|uniref:Autophagy-related protein 1 n=1 Tax=Parathielavia hyrcaniae TaxID=113614 RepID=A0AAN6T3V2_9PEZI|nr:kinase-like protein [Parathielavia hyrcaniae]
MSIPDLIVDSKLEAVVHPDWVRHTYARRGQSGKDWKIDVSETWVRKSRLGSGGFGTVWLEECQQPALESSPHVRAVKEIRKDPRQKVDYSRELLVIAKFSLPMYVPCFVQSYGWFETTESIYIAMEYMPHGDLKKHLARPLPEDEARTIGMQVLEGLRYMHENGFVHRDLKPQNILVVSPGPDWLVQISDFGISQRLAEEATVTMGQGTMGFMAPEVLGFVKRGSSPFAADIWSLGALLFFVLTNTIFLKDPHRVGEFAQGIEAAADLDNEKLGSIGVSREALNAYAAFSGLPPTIGRPRTMPQGIAGLRYLVRLRTKSPPLSEKGGKVPQSKTRPWRPQRRFRWTHQRHGVRQCQ